MISNVILQGDSLDVMKQFPDACVDLIYLDPPFFTQERRSLAAAKEQETYSFDDRWENMNEYLSYMGERLQACRRVMKETGSIFLHCDRNASHYLKVLMDQIFGISNFQSEIIWSYRRWSNSKKGLLNHHQVILFYSKTSAFKFHKIYTDYSETTNIDQILQDRVRNQYGKSVYKVDESGEFIVGKSKKGVPLSDVWEIPYLNPKAKERVGYPTQKPIILLEQIIKLVTDEGDLVLDPFVGSGTTVVAAKMLGRKYIGIDQSSDAVALTSRRLEELIKTESRMLKIGKSAYVKLTDEQTAILRAFHAVPVQRNSGIDGFLKEYINGRPVSVKIQRAEETLREAAEKQMKASRKKQCSFMLLIRTHADGDEFMDFNSIPEDMRVIDSCEMQLEKFLDEINGMGLQKTQNAI